MCRIQETTVAASSLRSRGYSRCVLRSSLQPARRASRTLGLTSLGLALASALVGGCAGPEELLLQEAVEVDAQALVADGFDYPVAPLGEYYVARDFEEDCHLGEDWNATTGGNTDCGNPVYAAAAGEVIYAQHAGSGWGNMVIIRHTLPDSTQVESMYGHLDAIGTSVSDQVFRGQQIGTIGDGGGACGDSDPYIAHLHFEIRTTTGLGAGPGYSCPAPAGWVDPSAFIDSHQPGTGGGPGNPSGPPSDWWCPPEYYSTLDGCDCGCGAPDPDCDNPGQAIYGCSPGQTCSTDGWCIP
jgi:murein DD-endopeptidase MepM/ murein hydrolase activator NlpD